jgi:hypothetical protein
LVIVQVIGVFEGRRLLIYCYNVERETVIENGGRGRGAL